MRSLRNWFASGKSHAATLYFLLPFLLLHARMGQVSEDAGIFERILGKTVVWGTTLLGTLDTPTGGS
jgi:hypothetical protein